MCHSEKRSSPNIKYIRTIGYPASNNFYDVTGTLRHLLAHKMLYPTTSPLPSTLKANNFSPTRLRAARI